MGKWTVREACRKARHGQRQHQKYSRAHQQAQSHSAQHKPVAFFRRLPGGVHGRGCIDKDLDCRPDHAKQTGDSGEAVSVQQVQQCRPCMTGRIFDLGTLHQMADFNRRDTGQNPAGQEVLNLGDRLVGLVDIHQAQHPEADQKQRDNRQHEEKRQTGGQKAAVVFSEPRKYIEGKFDPAVPLKPGKQSFGQRDHAREKSVHACS